MEGLESISMEEIIRITTGTTTIIAGIGLGLDYVLGKIQIGYDLAKLKDLRKKAELEIIMYNPKENNK